jgi:FixJ family two-component response regulator
MKQPETTTDYRYRLLMVDDDELLVKVVSSELMERGFEVETLTEPTATLEFLINMPVDLMLLDLKMPGMDGLTLLQEVEQMSPDLPVIILTGHGDLSSAAEAMRHGAVGYLQKPVKMEQLTGAIHEAIEKYGNAEERRQYLQERRRTTQQSTVPHISDCLPSTPAGDGELLGLINKLINNHLAVAGKPIKEQEWLPLISIDDYCQRVIQQYQNSMTETELSRRLGFSRDKLWRIRKRLGIPRK